MGVRGSLRYEQDSELKHKIRASAKRTKGRLWTTQDRDRCPIRSVLLVIILIPFAISLDRQRVGPRAVLIRAKSNAKRFPFMEGRINLLCVLSAMSTAPVPTLIAILAFQVNPRNCSNIPCLMASMSSFVDKEVQLEEEFERSSCTWSKDFSASQPAVL